LTISSSTKGEIASISLFIESSRYNLGRLESKVRSILLVLRRRFKHGWFPARLRHALFQPNLVIAMARLDDDFIFPGKPPDGHEKQAFGHPCSFDQRGERSRSTVGEHMPDSTGCFSDRSKFVVSRIAPRAIAIVI
jgi:hypothetical protein